MKRPVVAIIVAAVIIAVVVLYAGMFNTDMPDTDVSNTDIPDTDVSNTDVSNTDMPDTDVSNTDVSNTDVSNTDMPDTSLQSKPSHALDFQNAVIAVPTVESPVIPPEASHANNAFAVDFYRQVASGNDPNIFFSPASMYVAFSLLYEGARGNTADELQDAFGFDPDPVSRHNSTAHMMASINRDDPHATLSMANALWIADWFEVYGPYLGVAHDIYLAAAETVSFVDESGKANPDTINKINQWASDNTNGKIKKVIEPDSVDAMTAMVINNAIYFKGTWITQFLEDNTDELEFHVSAAESVKTDFMYNPEGLFNYAKSDGVQVLKMPYEGDRISMLVILPTQTDGIAQLESSLSADMIDEWRQNLEPTTIEVLMPKFTMKTKYDLKEPLESLDIIDVFDRYKSDLFGLAALTSRDNALYVSGAFQDAFVDVNEEGTEAAAVTTLNADIMSESPRPPIFRADHPFLFIIQDDESGMILFMGRFMGP